MEEGLDVGFGRRAPIQEFVGMNEGQVLPLFFREERRLGDRLRRKFMIDGAGGGHDERKVPHHADAGRA